MFQALVVATIIVLGRRMVTGPCRTRRARSTRSERSCRPRACSSLCRNPPGRDQQQAAGPVPRARKPRSWPASSLSSALASEPGKEALLSMALFKKPTSSLGSDHPEPSVAGADGGLVHRVGLPPDRTRLQRDQDRRDLHRGDRGHTGLLACRRATRQEVPQRTLIAAGFVVTTRPGSGFCLAWSMRPPRARGRSRRGSC